VGLRERTNGLIGLWVEVSTVAGGGKRGGGSRIGGERACRAGWVGNGEGRGLWLGSKKVARRHLGVRAGCRVGCREAGKVCEGKLFLERRGSGDGSDGNKKNQRFLQSGANETGSL